MNAVYRRELSSALHSLTGVLFIAFQLLVIGIYGGVLHFYVGYAEFETVVSQVSFIFLIIVPIVTMRALIVVRISVTISFPPSFCRQSAAGTVILTNFRYFCKMNVAILQKLNVFQPGNFLGGQVSPGSFG